MIKGKSLPDEASGGKTFTPSQQVGEIGVLQKLVHSLVRKEATRHPDRGGGMYPSSKRPQKEAGSMASSRV